MINNAFYLQNYILDLIKGNTPNYNGLLCEVVKYDNMFCEVKIKDATGQVTNLTNVPILANKYSRPFVQAGDLGVLLNVHTDFYNTLIGQENTYADINSYVFMPIIYKTEAVSGNSNGNTQIETSPDKANTMSFSNEGYVQKLKAHTDNVTNNYTLTAKNISETASSAYNAKGNSVTINSGTPITIKTSQEGSNLGSLLYDTLNDICTALSNAGVPIIIGDCSAQQNASLPGNISSIKAKMTRLKKVLS